MCENETINGVQKDGFYGEYGYLRSEAAVPISKEVDIAQIAPLLCAGVTVFTGLRKQEVVLGSLVAVQGLGGLGHLALQFASKIGSMVNKTRRTRYLPHNLAEAATPAFYPNASKGSSYFIVAGSGHFVNYHYSATAAYEHIHTFIKNNGF